MVKSCVVTGSGRSGTSMLTGMLAGAGYYMGSRPLPVNFRPPAERGTNPKGNFEDLEINAINEDILAALFPRPWPTRLGRVIQSRWVLGPGLRWAAAVPTAVEPSASGALVARIRAQVAHDPFCFKDPRFSHTLPVWRPHLGDAVFICVFREPQRTANSILREWRGSQRRYPMTYERALDAWRAAYTQILDRHCREGEWLFLHYDQILEGSATPRVEELLGATIDVGFPDPALKRSEAAGEVGPTERNLYLRLCELAGCADDGR